MVARGGGMCGCSGGVGMRGFFRGGVHGFFWGGMCGFFQGGMHGFSGGVACENVVFLGGRVWFFRGAWFFPGGVRRIRRDTVNERAVRIPLECILVCN